MADNILYVEGKSLDDFLLGHLALLPVRSNRIGTFVDPTGLDYIDQVVNTLNAARAVKGVACETYTVLREELGVKIEWSETGCAVGTVLTPEAIDVVDDTAHLPAKQRQLMETQLRAMSKSDLHPVHFM